MSHNSLASIISVKTNTPASPDEIEGDSLFLTTIREDLPKRVDLMGMTPNDIHAKLPDYIEILDSKVPSCRTMTGQASLRRISGQLLKLQTGPADDSLMETADNALFQLVDDSLMLRDAARNLLCA